MFLSLLSLPGALRDCEIGLPVGSMSSFHGSDAVWSTQFTREENRFSQGGLRGGFHRMEASREPSTPCPFDSHNSTVILTHPRLRAGKKMLEFCAGFYVGPTGRDGWDIFLNPKFMPFGHLLSMKSASLQLKILGGQQMKTPNLKSL